MTKDQAKKWATAAAVIVAAFGAGAGGSFTIGRAGNVEEFDEVKIRLSKIEIVFQTELKHIERRLACIEKAVLVAGMAGVAADRREVAPGEWRGADWGRGENNNGGGGGTAAADYTDEKDCTDFMDRRMK